MSRIKKAAIIGCGLISKNHLKALEQVDAAEIYAVCDIDPDKALTAARAYDVPVIYQDYHELLADPEVDTVHICTPHHLHCQMSIDSFAAGKHVLCEKPMALSVEDAKRMLAARDRAGKQLAVCFQNRYNEASIYLKELVASGKLGILLGARGQVTWNRKPEYYSESCWRGRWSTEGGGVLINQAIHTFDLLQWLTCEIKTVEASISTKRLKETIEVEDTADVLMEGTGGQRVLFYASNCYVKNAPVEMELIGTKGSVKLVGNKVFTELGEMVESHDYSSGAVHGKDYWGSGHGFLIQDFYHCIESGRAFPVSGEEAMVSVKLLEAVYASGRSGQSIKFREGEGNII